MAPRAARPARALPRAPRPASPARTSRSPRRGSLVVVTNEGNADLGHALAAAAHRVPRHREADAGARRRRGLPAAARAQRHRAAALGLHELPHGAAPRRRAARGARGQRAHRAAREPVASPRAALHPLRRVSQHLSGLPARGRARVRRTGRRADRRGAGAGARAPDDAKTLPFASSLCGSCTAVCPVRIDLHEQLLAWRRETNAQPAALRRGARIAACGDGPAVGSIASRRGRCAARRGRCSAVRSRANPAAGWLASRELAGASRAVLRRALAPLAGQADERSRARARCGAPRDAVRRRAPRRAPGADAPRGLRVVRGGARGRGRRVVRPGRARVRSRKP